MTQALLGITGLRSGYGRVEVLRGVDLAVNAGEIVALLGSNGAGKSTLNNTVSGLVPTWAGRVVFDGQDLTGAHYRRVVQAGLIQVPEGRKIFPNLTVRENLVMAARAERDGGRSWTFDRVMGTFPRLKERLVNLGSQLSGGEQQMLSIGRALMTQPDLIILDEATEGLAPLIVAEIWRVIGEIRDDGIATLIVDRDYRRVLAQSERAVVLQKGQVVLAGESSALRGDPALATYLGV